jgi:hypothetical protein
LLRRYYRLIPQALHMTANVISRRIVVVDHQETFRSHLVHRLLRDGHDACAVADSLSAIRLARWIALDAVIIGDPADVAADLAPGVLRYLVAFVIRLTDKRLAPQNEYDIVLPRAVDVLFPTLGGGRVAAASVDACTEEIRPGMQCRGKRGHQGLHRWRSSDTERSFVWG